MKFIKFTGAAAIVVIALAVLGVTLAFAQQPTPTDNPWWNTMRGLMHRNGGGMMGNSAFRDGGWESMQQMHNLMSQNGGMDVMHEWMHQTGGMNDSVWATMADQLGLTSEELTAQVNSGETLAQIAEEKGVAIQDLADTMEQGMKSGLEQAVEDNKLTQEQADLMLKNMDGRYEWMITNMGTGLRGGSMRGPGGMMSPGAGGCHNFD